MASTDVSPFLPLDWLIYRQTIESTSRSILHIALRRATIVNEHMERIMRKEDDLPPPLENIE